MTLICPLGTKLDSNATCGKACVNCLVIASTASSVSMLAMSSAVICGTLATTPPATSLRRRSLDRQSRLFQARSMVIWIGLSPVEQSPSCIGMTSQLLLLFLRQREACCWPQLRSTPKFSANQGHYHAAQIWHPNSTRNKTIPWAAEIQIQKDRFSPCLGLVGRQQLLQPLLLLSSPLQSENLPAETCIDSNSVG